MPFHWSGNEKTFSLASENSPIHASFFIQKPLLFFLVFTALSSGVLAAACLEEVGSVDSTDIQISHMNYTLDVAVSGNYAYVTGLSGDLFVSRTLAIIDVSDPANPNGVAEIRQTAPNMSYMAFPWAVDIEGDYAYISSGYGNPYGSLNIVNVSNPSTPVGVGQIKSSQDPDISGMNAPWDVLIHNNFAYLGVNKVDALDKPFAVIDVSNPASPDGVAQLDATDPEISGITKVFGLGLKDHYIFAAGDRSVSVIDIANPLAPNGVAQISNSDPQIPNLAPSGIVVVGDYLYAASPQAISAIDISDPLNPDGVAEAPNVTDYGAYGRIAETQNLLLVSKRFSGHLGVLDISDQDSPKKIFELALSPTYEINSLASQGNYLYVVGDTPGFPSWLKIFKIDKSTCLNFAANCGNGIVEPGETCDDGATIDGDGCSSTCTIETLCTFSPPYAYDTGSHCFTQNYSAGISDYVTRKGGLQINHVNSAVCGPAGTGGDWAIQQDNPNIPGGYFLLDVPDTTLFPSYGIPTNGRYVLEFDAVLGDNPGEPEDFNVECGGKEYSFRELLPSGGTVGQSLSTTITCDVNSVANPTDYIAAFKATQPGSVHPTQFRLFKCENPVVAHCGDGVQAPGETCGEPGMLGCSLEDQCDPITCQCVPIPEPLNADVLALYLEMTDASGAEKTQFLPGETMQIKVSVTNKTSGLLSNIPVSVTVVDLSGTPIATYGQPSDLAIGSNAFSYPHSWPINQTPGLYKIQATVPAQLPDESTPATTANNSMTVFVSLATNSAVSVPETDSLLVLVLGICCVLIIGLSKETK